MPTDQDRLSLTLSDWHDAASASGLTFDSVLSRAGVFGLAGALHATSWDRLDRVLPRVFATFDERVAGSGSGLYAWWDWRWDATPAPACKICEQLEPHDLRHAAARVGYWGAYRARLTVNSGIRSDTAGHIGGQPTIASVLARDPYLVGRGSGAAPPAGVSPGGDPLGWRLLGEVQLVAG